MDLKPSFLIGHTEIRPRVRHSLLLFTLDYNNTYIIYANTKLGVMGLWKNGPSSQSSLLTAEGIPFEKSGGRDYKATPNKTVVSHPDVFIIRCGWDAYYHYSLLKM